MRRSFRLALLALMIGIPAAAALAQTETQTQTPTQAPTQAPPPLPEFELGYRFVDVSGNDQMYRSQINDRPGFLLHMLSWNSTAPLDGVFDYAHLDADDLGAGPAGSLRFSAGQMDIYRLNFTWRRTNLYSALPAFANPFLDDGIVPGQQTYNRSRDVYDAELQIFPGKKFTPILGFTRNIYRGPGTTTYHVGENEFALDDRVQSVDDEYRIGLAFDVGPVRGAVIQGWRRYRWSDTASLQAGAGDGNISFPILGQPITADGIARTTTSKVNTPVTSAWVSGQLFSRVKLIGSYVRADANGDAQSAETDNGSFVSFQIARFFAGLDDSISSKAKTDYWRGSIRAEINLLPSLDLTAGWTEKSRTLDGLALVTSLYLDTVTYAGVSVGDLQKLVQNDTAIDRTDRTFDATVTARLIGPLVFNAGWSQTHQDVTFSDQTSEVLAAEPGQNFTRTVNTYGTGVSYSCAGLTFSADYRRDDGDQPIFRTDFTGRDRFKLRGGWKWKDLVQVGATWQETKAHGDAPEIGYSTKVRELLADVEVGPVAKILTFHASAGEFKTTRDILIRQPQDFDIVPSAQREMGHTWEGGLRALWKSLTVDAAYLWMQNNGSIPFTINRVRARAEYAFGGNIGVVGEWIRDQYGEKPAFDQAGSLADYNANRYGIYLHWRP
jgi:hypothetical protein